MGSSPLTRGKPDWRRVRRVDDRLIPAQAGKTRRRRAPSSASPAHPRSRRENVAEQAAKSASTGSSPLTRGKHRRVGTARAPRGIIPAPRGKRGVLLRALSGPGFIPAHAGKTSQSSAHRACPRVHPRSRGENGSLFLHRHMVLGSSPLTRGKPAELQTGAGLGGLMPAHAGKTRICS